MLQYRLKYETVRIQMPFQENDFLFNIFSLLSIFNSMFSLSSHCFLSPSTSLALSVLALSPSPISPRRSRHRWSRHADLATPRDRDRSARHWSRPALRRRGTPVWRTRWPEVKLPSATATEAVWNVGLFDLVDGMRFVEFYNWFSGFGMWVCTGGRCGFVPVMDVDLGCGFVCFGL